MPSRVSRRDSFLAARFVGRRTPRRSPRAHSSSRARARSSTPRRPPLSTDPPRARRRGDPREDDDDARARDGRSRAQRSPEGRPRGFLAAISSHDPSAQDDDARVAAPEPKIVDASTANLGAKIKETTARVVRPARPAEPNERRTQPTLTCQKAHAPRLAPAEERLPATLHAFIFFIFFRRPGRVLTPSSRPSSSSARSSAASRRTRAGTSAARARVRGALRGGVGVSGNPRSCVAFRYCYQCHKFHELDAFVGGEGEVRNRHNCTFTPRSRNASSGENRTRARGKSATGRERRRRVALLSQERSAAAPRAALSCRASPTPPPGGARPRKVHRETRTETGTSARWALRTPPPPHGGEAPQGGDDGGAPGARRRRPLGVRQRPRSEVRRRRVRPLRVRRRRLRVRQRSRASRRDAARCVRQRHQRRQPPELETLGAAGRPEPRGDPDGDDGATAAFRASDVRTRRLKRRERRRARGLSGPGGHDLASRDRRVRGPGGRGCARARAAGVGGIGGRYRGGREGYARRTSPRCETTVVIVRDAAST